MARWNESKHPRDARGRWTDGLSKDQRRSIRRQSRRDTSQWRRGNRSVEQIRRSRRYALTGAGVGLFAAGVGAPLGAVTGLAVARHRDINERRHELARQARTKGTGRTLPRSR